MARIAILHTSDLHNRLNSSLSARIREIKKVEGSCLLFDSGDAIGSGNIYWTPGGEETFEYMNSIPYDAMCAGNREFHIWSYGMNEKLCRAEFPVLSANLRPKGKVVVPVRQYTFFDRDGIRIGVFGLSVQNVKKGFSFSYFISNYYHEDPIIAAKEIVCQMIDKCDVLIALTHIGIDKDKELAQEVDGIDLILGGHSHTATSDPLCINNTVIIHHSYHGRFIGKTEILYENGITCINDEMIPLLAEMIEDD